MSSNEQGYGPWSCTRCRWAGLDALAGRIHQFDEPFCPKCGGSLEPEWLLKTPHLEDHEKLSGGTAGSV
jgi:hypothetical protein